MGSEEAFEPGPTQEKEVPNETNPAPGDAPPSTVRGYCAQPRLRVPQAAVSADYISHNAPRDGQGRDERLEPGLRHERPARAVFLGRRLGEGRWEATVACAVTMSASAGVRESDLRPPAELGRTPAPFWGSGREQ